MSIRDNKYIQVYNYTPHMISVPTSKQNGLMFAPATSETEPSSERMTFEEIEYANGHSGAFKLGLLRFDADQEEELFDELRCPNWKSALISESDIDEIVFHPSAKTLSMLANIRSAAVMERIRARLIHAINVGENISMPNANNINLRYDEIRSGKYTSALLETAPVYENSAVKAEDVNALKEQIEQLRAMLTAQKTPESEVEVQPKPEQAAKSATTETKPKRGRPAASKK